MTFIFIYITRVLNIMKKEIEKWGLLTIILLAATPNIVTSLGQEYGHVYVKVVDADSRKPLPNIEVEIEGDGYYRGSYTNSSGVAEIWISSDKFGVFTVRALDILGQELTLNVTTIDITEFGRVFVLESTDSRFVNIRVIDSLTGLAPPFCSLLESGEIPYSYWQTYSLDGNISIVLREGSSRDFLVGSPLRKAVSVHIPVTGDFEETISMEPAVFFNVSLTGSSEAEISIIWDEVEYFDRYARQYGYYSDTKTLIQYVVDLTLVKSDGYSRKNVRLGTLSFEKMSGEKTWTCTLEGEWLNSTAICSISVDMDWLEKMWRSPYGYLYTWSWIYYYEPLMEAVFPLSSQALLQKYTDIKSRYSLLQSNYASLEENYQTLESELNELTANYTNLNENYQELQSNYASLREDYENLKGQTYLAYVFIATTVIFIATTIYFARKK